MDWNSVQKGFRGYMLLEMGLSEHTIAAYLRDLDKLVQFLALSESVKRPQEVTRQDLQNFLRYLNEIGLAPRSQARLLSAIKSFYRFLLLEELVEHNPVDTIDAPKLGRKIPEVLSFEEIQSMLASIDLSTPHGQRNRAMLETLYACGLRVSELVGLHVNDLYLELGYVKVSGKGDKERIIPIGEEAVKHIRFYLEGVRRHLKKIDPEHRQYLFLNRRGKQLTRVYVFMVVKELAKAAGIQKTVSPHTFRHSFATHLIEGGANLKAVQDMLGHESIITTEIYTHLDTEYLRDTILTYHPSNQKK
jgi:integrase/recombinase XerD